MAEDRPQEEEREPEKDLSSEDESLLPYLFDPLQAIDIIAPQATKALMENSPDKLLDFVEGYDKRQYDLALLQEKNQHEEEESRQANKKFTILTACIAAVVLFLGSLFYAASTKDKTLPKDLLNILLSIGGSSGATYGLLKSQEKKNEP